MDLNARSPWPQRTTAAAGAVLLTSGLLQLLVRAQVVIPLTENFAIPLFGVVVAVLAAVLHGVGFAVAAIGIHGEVGITGTRPVGRIALIVWGLEGVAVLLLPTAQSSTSIDVVTPILFALAALLATIAVLRAGVLGNLGRWAFIAVLAVKLAALALFNLAPLMLDLAAVSPTLAALPLEYVDPTLTFGLAVSLLIWGRSEAVKYRAQTVRDAW